MPHLQQQKKWDSLYGFKLDVSLMVEPNPEGIVTVGIVLFLCIIFQAEENNRDGEEEEDEWEDASDEEDEMPEEGSESDHLVRDGEKKDREKEKPSESKDELAAAPPAPCPQQSQAGSPKEQRTPRPKVHIPSPAPAQDSPEGGKPLSPFLPLDSHRPVSDWGEEMEMLSPRSSVGGESPLKPQSVEASPAQKKDQDENENKGSSSNEAARPEREDDPGDWGLGSDVHRYQLLCLSVRL